MMVMLLTVFILWGSATAPALSMYFYFHTYMHRSRINELTAKLDLIKGAPEFIERPLVYLGFRGRTEDLPGRI